MRSIPTTRTVAAIRLQADRSQRVKQSDVWTKSGSARCNVGNTLANPVAWNVHAERTDQRWTCFDSLARIWTVVGSVKLLPWKERRARADPANLPPQSPRMSLRFDARQNLGTQSAFVTAFSGERLNDSHFTISCAREVQEAGARVMIGTVRSAEPTAS